MITCEKLTFTLNSAGGGTVLSTRPLSGQVVEVRVPLSGTAWAAVGSVDFTFTRLEDGGTVFAVSNASAPFSYQPSTAYHTVAGVVAGTATRPGIPIDDHLKMVVAQGVVSQPGTVYVYVDS